MTTWAELHLDQRQALRYPSEHVVRFLAALPADLDEDGYRDAILDIGCGSGRHLATLTEMGFFAYGVELSPPAVCRARARGAAGGVEVAPITRLPYPANHFDAAIAYAVFYYGTVEEGQQAINEMHRVLRPGGQAFVCVRTTRDWRTHDLQPEDPEWGMVMHFIDEHDITRLYDAFTHVRYELSEWTTNNRARLNSDWLITVTK